MLKDYEKFFGAAFIRIINYSPENITLKKFNKKFNKKSNASFVLNDSIGLYFKYCKKRLTPWRFSFLKEHQDEILEMKETFNHAFLIFNCWDDGIVCLSFEELKEILDDNHEDVEWISVSRFKNEKYKINGKNGKLKFKIGDSDFPKKLFE